MLVCTVSCGVGSFSERGAHHKRAYTSACRTISKSRLAPHPYSIPSTATRLKTPLKYGCISTSGSIRQYQHQHQHQSRPRQSKPAAPALRRVPLVPYHWNRCPWRDGAVRNQPGARTSTRFSRREAYHGRRWGTLLVREHCALGVREAHSSLTDCTLPLLRICSQRHNAILHIIIDDDPVRFASVICCTHLFMVYPLMILDCPVSVLLEQCFHSPHLKMLRAVCNGGWIYPPP